MGISSSWFDRVKSYVRSSFRNELEWGEDIKGTKYKMVNYIITRIFIMPINIHTHCFTVKGTKCVPVLCSYLVFLCYYKIFSVNTKYVLLDKCNSWFLSCSSKSGCIIFKFKLPKVTIFLFLILCPGFCER